MAIKFNPLTGDFEIVQRSQPQANVVLRNVDCDSSVIVGDWVRMDALGIAQKAQADSESNANVLGLVEYKASSVLANVRVLGVSEPIFSSLDMTQEYLLSPSTAGAMTTTAPTSAGQVVLKVGQPYSEDKFLVLKGVRFIRT